MNCLSFFQSCLGPVLTIRLFSSVWRGGVSIHIPQSHIVVGDLVELAAGDEIPADGIFVFGDDPAVNECKHEFHPRCQGGSRLHLCTAKMTGESRDIDKDYFDPFLLAGTELRKGQCAMLVSIGCYVWLSPLQC